MIIEPAAEAGKVISGHSQRSEVKRHEFQKGLQAYRAAWQEADLVQMVHRPIFMSEREKIRVEA
jgi:hypothetical protein